MPGDICGLRVSAFQGSYRAIASLFQHPGRDLDPDSAGDIGWEAARAVRLYDAVPYFVPALTSLSIARSEPPAAELLNGIRLPFLRSRLLGADLAVPPSLLGGEEVLRERMRFQDKLLRSESTEVAAHLMPPVRTHACLIGLLSRLPVCLSGVVLFAGPDGTGLNDLVMWFTSTELSGGRVTRRIDPGFLSSARLAPIAHNVAAAVTWGP